MSLIVISSLLIFGNFAKYFSVVFAPGSDPVKMAELTMYIAIFTLFYAIPMAHLIGMFLLFSSLSANNEYIALLASGVTFTRLIKPIFIISVLVFVLAFLTNFYAMPYGKQHYKSTLFDITKATIANSIQEKTFYNRIGNIVIYAAFIDREDNLRKVFIEKDEKKNNILIFAKKGKLFSYNNSLFFKLSDGKMINPDKSTIENFSLMDMKIEDFKPFIDIDNLTNPSYMTLNRLIKYRPTGSKLMDFKIFLNKHLASILSLFIFSLIGMALGIHFPRSGKSGAYGLSMLILILYYVILIFSQKLANLSHLPALLWLSDLIFAAVAIILINHTFKEVSLGNLRKKFLKALKK